jgi:hypothetical protein
LLHLLEQLLFPTITLHSHLKILVDGIQQRGLFGKVSAVEVKVKVKVKVKVRVKVRVTVADSLAKYL